MSGFRTDQLKTALELNLPPLHAYDVCASDELPRHRIGQRPVCLVVNTEASGDPGIHWQAIYLPDVEEEAPEFFCSNGREMSQSVAEFLGLQGDYCHALATDVWLQHPLSVSCGLFCLDFLLFRATGLGSFSDYAARFTRNRWLQNENELWRYWNISSAADAPDSFWLEHSDTSHR